MAGVKCSVILIIKTALAVIPDNCLITIDLEEQRGFGYNENGIFV